MANLLIDIGNTTLKASWADGMTLGKTFRYQGEKKISFILSSSVLTDISIGVLGVIEVSFVTSIFVGVTSFCGIDEDVVGVIVGVVSSFPLSSSPASSFSFIVDVPVHNICLI